MVTFTGRDLFGKYWFVSALYLDVGMVQRPSSIKQPQVDAWFASVLTTMLSQ
jgi:hypothetical protein